MSKKDMNSADYCAKCDAPSELKYLGTYLARCGTCAVINGKLPPTKYQPLKRSEK